MRTFTSNGKPYSFRQVAANYRRVSAKVPRVLGTIAVNYFKDSFRRQGWRDKQLTKWPARAKSDRKPGRAILVKSGRLRNSIILSKADARMAQINAQAPYALAHNEGFKGTVQVSEHTRQLSRKVKVQFTSIESRKVTSRSKKLVIGETKVRAHSRQMNLPQRQFMGDSEVMFMKFDAAIIKAIDQVFNN